MELASFDRGVLFGLIVCVPAFICLLSVIAGVLFVVGYVPYIRAIVSRGAKPAKVSWIVWATLDTITIAGMYFEDALNGQIVGACIGAWVVVALAFKYGTPGWTKLDKFCVAGAVLAVVLWQVFSNPVLGIMASLSVVSLGSIPTFASAWRDQNREDKMAWAIFWVSSVCAIIAIPQWNLTHAAQPISSFAINTVMMYILYVRSR